MDTGRAATDTVDNELSRLKGLIAEIRCNIFPEDAKASGQVNPAKSLPSGCLPLTAQPERISALLSQMARNLEEVLKAIINIREGIGV